MDFTSPARLPDNLPGTALQQPADYIAHLRKTDNAIQTVSAHLSDVAEIAKNLAAKIAVPEAGELIGLLHDFGKYSAAFQTYIRTETGLLEPDGDDQLSQKGKIDHSTAGAQWLWQTLAKFGTNGEGQLCGQILALCVASHHGGLIDNLLTRMKSLDGASDTISTLFDAEERQLHRRGFSPNLLNRA